MRTKIGPDGIRCPKCGALDRLSLIEVLPMPPNAPASSGGAGRWRCQACRAIVLDMEGELSVEERDE